MVTTVADRVASPTTTTTTTAAGTSSALSNQFRNNNNSVYRLHFFVNGDRHFTGLHYVANVDRLRTLDSLCAELSRILITVKSLPSGVRIIFDEFDGSKLESLQDLRHNHHYVCSSVDHFIRLNYRRLRLPPLKGGITDSGDKEVNHLAPSTLNAMAIYHQMATSSSSTSARKQPKKRQTSSNSSSIMSPTLSSTTSYGNCSTATMKPKIVALLRGACRAEPHFRPSRRAFRFLLNQRIAQNYEQLLNEISKCVKLNAGAVYRICALTSTKKITCLQDFFDDEQVYIVYGRSEKCTRLDFMLDEYEIRDIGSIVGSGFGNTSSSASASSTEKPSCKPPAKSRKVSHHHRSSYKANGKSRLSSANTGTTVADSKKSLDGDLRTSSLPRNFHASYTNRRSKYSANPAAAAATSLDRQTSNKENIPRNTSGKVESNGHESSSSSRFSSLYSLNESSDEKPSNGYYYSRKHCPSAAYSENYLSENGSTSSGSNSRRRNHNASNLVLRNDCSKFEDCYGDPSGSSTPGATSSVSCSEEFTYASVEGNDNVFGEDKDEPDSSCDSSTPSFSSQSYVVDSSAHCTVAADSTDSKAQAEGKKYFVPKKEVAKFYALGEAIGDGKFGVVYTCVHRQSGQSFAMKVVNKGTMQQMMQHCENEQTLCTNSEANILKRLEHDNIVKLFEHFDFVDQSYLILELLKGGDLFDAVTQANCYTEMETVEIVNDLVNAIAYLHQNSIVHRDIKLENLMVDFVPISGGVNSARLVNQETVPRRYRQIIKLTDFGLAVQIKEEEKLYTVCGTPIYVAPEILLEIGYSFPVDIWAAGVIAYILLSGYPPFNNEDQSKLFDLILGGKIEFPPTHWSAISPSAKKLIKSMLTVEQSQRISAEQVLRHKWIQSNLC